MRQIKHFSIITFFLIENLVICQSQKLSFDSIQLVKDIYTGVGSSSPSNFFNIDHKLVFMATDGLPSGNTTKHIWITDGTEEGTKLLKDISCAMAQNIQIEINGIVFFGGSDEISGWELWKTDGTSEGTILIKDILPGNLSSCPQNFMTAFGKLIFLATTNIGPPPYYIIHEKKVFRSDGTSSGTFPINITNGKIVVLKNSAYVFANNSIFRTNKDFDTISIIKQVDVLSPTQYFSKSIKANDSLMFFIQFTGNESKKSNLWRSDGTSEGTFLLMESFNLYINDYTIVDSILFFTADDGKHGTELWKSNGSVSGTKLVKDISAGISSPGISNLTAFKGKLYFFVDHGVTGSDLWVSDGTENGTLLFKDISTGYFNCCYKNLHVHNEHLYFTLINKKDITELWESDGTSEKTHFLKYLTTNGNSSVSDLIFMDSFLFFIKKDTIYGEELWRYDLPAEDPAPVNQIFNDNYSIYPNPVHDILHLYPQDINKHIIIFDLYGRTIFNDYIEDNFLDISFLRSGFYILLINNTKLRIIKI